MRGTWLAGLATAATFALAASPAGAEHKVELTCDPCTVQIGQKANLEAVTAGKPIQVRWDLDGDGKFETDTGDRLTASASFANPGAYDVAVVVTASGQPAHDASDIARIRVVDAPEGEEVVVGFDDFPPGTRMYDQVPGIRFDGSATVFSPVNVPTFSPPHALRAAGACGPSDSCNDAYSLAVYFPDRAATSVKVRVGLDDRASSGGGTWARLVGNGVDGSRIADSGDLMVAKPNEYGPIEVQLTIADPEGRIARATVFVGFGTASHDTAPRRVEIDDVRFRLRLPDPPRVSIYAPGEHAFFHRAADAGFSGQVTAPAGVARFCVVADRFLAPVPDTCDQAGLLGPPSGYRGADRSFTNVAPIGLGPGFHRVGVFVEDRYGRVAVGSRVVEVLSEGQVDLRVTSMEVTQGTQYGSLPYAAAPGAPVRYAGVQLARRRQTVVRVFANAARATLSRPVAGARVPAVLFGHHQVGGREIPLPGSDGRPGSALLPRTGPRDLVAGPSVVTYAERGRPAGGYVFVLPRSWTVHGDDRLTRLKLSAEVNPTSILPFIAERPAERANNRFTLTDIPFHKMRPVVVSPVSMGWQPGPGQPWVYPDPVHTTFNRTFDLLPLADAGLVVRPFQAFIDISDIAQERRRTEAALTAEGVPREHERWRQANDRANSRVWDRMTEWERGHDQPGLPIGLNRDVARGLSIPVFFAELARADQIAVADQRQIISVAHELVHSMRIRHASAACGAGDWSDAWPPDETGQLQGVGLDPRAQPGLPTGTFRMYLGRGLPTNPELFTGQRGVYYDLMSYCAGDDGGAWISPRTWNSIIDGVKEGGGLPNFYEPWAVRGVVTAHAAQAGPALSVAAVISRAGELLTLRASPVERASPTPAAPGSAYRVVVRNAGGAVVSDTRVAPAPGSESDLVALTADVPAPGAAQVEVLRGEQVLGTLRRSAATPTVALLTPARGGRLRGRGTNRLAWRATDADGDDLRARIDFSPNGGRTWRPVALGLNGTTYALPGSLLERARRARLRVVVSDGFNEAAATSGVLHSEGRPPEARIVRAPAGAVAAGTVVGLAGQAFDDRGRPLAGRRLRWLEGKRLLGRGTQVDLRGLRPGTHRIRLLARDRHGRRGDAAVRVRVQPVTPQLLGLRVPKRISRRARRVTLRTAATTPATLRIGPRRFDIGLRPRRVSVPLRPGRSAVTLTLRLSSGRLRSQATVVIARR